MQEKGVGSSLFWSTVVLSFAVSLWHVIFWRIDLNNHMWPEEPVQAG